MSTPERMLALMLESFDRTGLSSKESHVKQKYLAVERKAIKPFDDYSRDSAAPSRV
ncbi:hypothetical protein E4U17_004831 [Claviceps sp. LM77 group G4]|nr:hypothetical protein E4U17_004831 [Claviceps sp. LM77 group G4]KAG6072634.1 hypothetical protein E4U16_005196 [Claviceps sp. LM84 group G4]KAG6085863.1 hypothetical protein E4U33_000803 [Claviceps sp. LM78 group G4]